MSGIPSSNPAIGAVLFPPQKKSFVVFPHMVITFLAAHCLRDSSKSNLGFVNQ